MNLVHLKTDNPMVNVAYYTAVSDLIANIKPFQGGLNEKAEPVIIAGIGYYTPWTRDASINTANAGGILFPDIAKNTLMSVLKNEDGKIYIDGEYWDKIIWVWGAWNEYLYTGDKEFLKIAYEAAKNTFAFFEETEFDAEMNLFRGAACYGDGIAAYPDVYSQHGESGIMHVTQYCKELLVDKGVGLPMFSLSTNCLYAEAYRLADKMAEVLGEEALYAEKYENMKKAINEHFWMEEKGLYRYLVDPFGGCDFSEGMGQSFAILFDIADDRQKKLILENQHITPNGIACVWPQFDRYKRGNHYGRHCGTVWPHIQAFWADAAAKNSRYDLFDKEFNMLTRCSYRDGHFAEIYHPDTSEIYGGIQERDSNGIIEWKSELKQTWSATGYLRMILMDIFGMSFKEDGIEFSPYLPVELNELELTGLTVRGTTFNVTLRRGTKTEKLFVPYDGDKEKSVSLFA